MFQTFPGRGRESLTADMADDNQDVIPLYRMARTPKAKVIQKTNVSHNRLIHTIITRKKGAQS
jgi:hypothetical protein